VVGKREFYSSIKKSLSSRKRRGRQLTINMGDRGGSVSDREQGTVRHQRHTLGKNLAIALRSTDRRVWGRGGYTFEGGVGYVWG